MGEGFGGAFAQTVPGLCRMYRYIAKGSHDRNALFLGQDHTHGIQSVSKRLTFSGEPHVRLIIRDRRGGFPF